MGTQSGIKTELLTQEINSRIQAYQIARKDQSPNVHRRH